MFGHRTLFIALSISSFAVSASAGPIVYSVGIDYNDFTGQFGTMDLSAGTFNPIGPVISDPIYGLMPAPNGQLLSLSVSGNLVSVNPGTGTVSVISATGLGGLAGVATEFKGTVYATDLYNNFFSVNTTTGAASLIGPTGMPICPSLISPTQVSDETLFTADGKLYATFDGIDLVSSALVDSPELYQIDPATGLASPVGPTALGLNAVEQINGIIYGLAVGYAGSNTVLSLNLTNGNTTYLNDYAASSGPGGGSSLAIVGVAQAPEPASLGLLGVGIAALIAFRSRRPTAWL